MIIQIKADEVIGEDFKDMARKNDISHQVLFEFLLMEFLRNGTPQVRAGKLNKLEKK